LLDRVFLTCVFLPRAPDPGEDGRGEAGKRRALAGEVRLVGVAALRRERGQVGPRGRGVDQTHEAMEAEHPLQRLGAVAGRCLAAPAELPLAQADFRRDGLGPDGRVPQQNGRPGHRRVGRAVDDQPAGEVEHPVHSLFRVERRRQPPGSGR
jgi:hypothetical protein